MRNWIVPGSEVRDREGRRGNVRSTLVEHEQRQAHVDWEDGSHSWVNVGDLERVERAA